MRGGFNTYAYVGGNPLTRVDPTGQAAALAELIIVGGVVYVGATIYITNQQSQVGDGDYPGLTIPPGLLGPRIDPWTDTNSTATDPPIFPGPSDQCKKDFDKEREACKTAVQIASLNQHVCLGLVSSIGYAREARGQKDQIPIMVTGMVRALASRGVDIQRMRLRPYFIYVLKLFWYWASKLIVDLSRLLARTPIFPSFFKALIAARAVGAGSQAYKQKRYQDALMILKSVADFEIDDVSVGSAQYIVGLLYFHGLGVKKDTMRAEKYFSEAARRQNDDAMSYFSGKQQAKDPDVDQ